MHPAMKMRIIPRLSWANGFLKAAVIKTYFPKISRMNEPLNPGRIMAQIAIIPLKNIYHGSSGVCSGISPVIP